MKFIFKGTKQKEARIHLFKPFVLLFSFCVKRAIAHSMSSFFSQRLWEGGEGGGGV